jgi:ADP-ribosylglycohydrolase
VIAAARLDASDRAVGALVGLAIGDALGAPVEFCRRDTFELVTEMRAGGYFRLPAGAWTDDTAMALCLAESLIEYPQLEPKDLLDRFCLWASEGADVRHETPQWRKSFNRAEPHRGDLQRNVVFNPFRWTAICRARAARLAERQRA